MKEQSGKIVGIDWSVDSHTCYDLKADKSFKIRDSFFEKWSLDAFPNFLSSFIGCFTRKTYNARS